MYSMRADNDVTWTKHVIGRDYTSLIMYSYNTGSAQKGPSLWLLGRPLLV